LKSDIPFALSVFFLACIGMVHVAVHVASSLRCVLQKRHRHLCARQDERWTGKILRQPGLGKVGLCIGCCVKTSGWRDLLLPRWEGILVISPRLAWIHEQPTHDLPQTMLKASIFAMAPHHGELIYVSLKDLQPAPQSDAERFRALMKEAAES